jgi:ABC-2 type transport system permease protein
MSATLTRESTALPVPRRRLPAVSARRIWAIATRVLHELERDPRARVVMVGTPGALVVLVRYLFDSDAAFSPTGAIMVGIFPVFTMYLVGSTSLVRERSRGTLEAVLATPTSRLDLVGGYLTAAFIIAIGQSVVTTTLAYLVSGLQTASPPWVFGLIAGLSGLFGMSLGLLISAIVRNEGQAFQALPGFFIPQMLVTGIVFPVDQMAGWVQGLERALPLSTVSRSLTAARLHHYGGASLALNVAILLCLIVAALLGAAATIRRRTA